MRSHLSMSAGTGTLIVLMALPLSGSAQLRPREGASHSAYKVMFLSSLGGASSFAEGVNDRDWIAGSSYLSGSQSQHATLWTFKPNRMLDLGTLGGANSTLESFHDGRGLIAGFSDTSMFDPLNENFCLLGSGAICEGFVWQGHGLVPLPPLAGGNNSEASDVNDLGQVTGDAENGTHDPGCISPTVLDYEAVIWGPKKNHIKELPPIVGDTSGAGVGINDNGDVVGESGPCGLGQDSLSAYLHAVLWRRGKPIALPTLGGTNSNIGFSINEGGEAAGYSALTGNATVHAAFWKTSRSVADLGTLPGDAQSYGVSINNAGQIVGASCGVVTCRAFLWQNGGMIDLNTLIPPSSRYLLTGAGAINDSGVIVGGAYDTTTGDTIGFVAIPTGQSSARTHGNPVHPVILSNGVLQRPSLRGRRPF